MGVKFSLFWGGAINWVKYTNIPIPNRAKWVALLRVKTVYFVHQLGS